MCELGADEFVDVDQKRFENVTGEVDVVFDPVGGEVRKRSRAVIIPGGVLISVVPPPEEARSRGARGIFFVVEPNRVELVELTRLIDAGELRSIVGEVFPLRRSREASEAKRRSGTPGKVVLQVVD